MGDTSRIRCPGALTTGDYLAITPDMAVDVNCLAQIADGVHVSRERESPNHQLDGGTVTSLRPRGQRP
jgi:hypothetical protein